MSEEKKKAKAPSKKELMRDIENLDKNNTWLTDAIIDAIHSFNHCICHQFASIAIIFIMK